jgi:hypothetical protein
MKKNIFVAVMCLVLMFGFSFLSLAQCSSDADFVKCLSVRVKVAGQVRGPSQCEIDSPFSEVNIGGTYQGYTAASTLTGLNGAASFLASGPAPWAMTSSPVPCSPPPPQPTPALGPGDSGSFDECGRWIDSVYMDGTQVLAWYHAEKRAREHQLCDGFDEESMGLAISYDNGQSFTPIGQVISSPNSRGVPTGREGDATVVKFGNYYYMYILRADPNFKTIVARSSVNDQGRPGTWYKYYNGGWTQAGLGGVASPLCVGQGNDQYCGNIGNYASLLTGTNRIMLMFPAASDPTVYRGLIASFSSDGVNFTALMTGADTPQIEPILPLEDTDWKRPDPVTGKEPQTELVAYPSAVNYTDGSNRWDGAFLLFYEYIQPYEGFGDRYLANRDVYVTVNSQQLGKKPHAGVELTRWHNSSTSQYWATTAMVPGANVSWTNQKNLGYVMTTPPSNGSSTPLFDCYLDGWNNHFIYTVASCGDGGTNMLQRRLGWIYTTPPTDGTPTVPIYQCFNPVILKHVVSNSPDCEGLGNPAPWVTGYVLAQ